MNHKLSRSFFCFYADIFFTFKNPLKVVLNMHPIYFPSALSKITYKSITNKFPGSIESLGTLPGLESYRKTSNPESA